MHYMYRPNLGECSGGVNIYQHVNKCVNRRRWFNSNVQTEMKNLEEKDNI